MTYALRTPDSELLTPNSELYNGHIYFRPPEEIEEKVDLKTINYTSGNWGIKTFKYAIECIYSLKQNKLLIDSKFFTTDHYNRRDELY